MNKWQVCQQVAHLIKSVTWASGAKIFFSGSTTGDDVFVAPIDPVGAIKIHTLPCAIVRALDQTNNKNNEPRPEEVEFTIEVVICASIPGDGDAGSSILGRNTLAGDVGRGIYEIEEKVKDTLDFLTDWKNIRFSYISTSTAKTALLSETGNFASSSLLYNVRGTSFRSYGPARRLRRTGTGLSVVLTWELPSDRFDSYGVRLFRHTSKITAFGTGTEIVLSGPTAITVTNSPGAGTYYYAIFGEYLEPGNATKMQSEPVNLRVVAA